MAMRARCQSLVRPTTTAPRQSMTLVRGDGWMALQPDRLLRRESLAPEWVAVLDGKNLTFHNDSNYSSDICFRYNQGQYKSAAFRLPHCYGAGLKGLVREK